MAQEREGKGMRFSGWAFLILSWGAIIILTIFCFYRIFTKKKVD